MSTPSRYKIVLEYTHTHTFTTPRPIIVSEFNDKALGGRASNKYVGAWYTTMTFSITGRGKKKKFDDLFCVSSLFRDVRFRMFKRLTIYIYMYTFEEMYSCDEINSNDEIGGRGWRGWGKKKEFWKITGDWRPARRKRRTLQRVVKKTALSAAQHTPHNQLRVKEFVTG